MKCINCGGISLFRKYYCLDCRKKIEEYKRKATKGYVFEVKGLKYRQKLKKEDDYKCLLCGEIENKHKFHIHHIRMTKDYGWDSRKRKKYLITVCSKCHKKIHFTLKDRKPPLIVNRNNFKKWFENLKGEEVII